MLTNIDLLMNLVPSLDNMCGEGRRKIQNNTVRPRNDTWFVRQPNKSSKDTGGMRGSSSPVRNGRNLSEMKNKRANVDDKSTKSKKDEISKETPRILERSEERKKGSDNKNQSNTENTESSEDKLNEIIAMLETDEIDEDKLPNINILDIDDMTAFDNATSIDVFDKNNPFDQNQDVDPDLDKYMVDLGPDEDRLDEDEDDQD